MRAGRAAVAHAQRAQLAEQRRVEGGVHGRVGRRRREVGHGRVRLPVEQERSEHDQRSPPPARGAHERARRHRPGHQRAQAVGVPAHRRGHHVGADQHQRIQRRADAQQALLWFDQQADRHHAGERRIERGGHERLRAPFRERQREQRDRSERGDGERRRPPPIRADQRPRQERQRQERARHRAGQRAQDAQGERTPPVPAAHRQQRAQADGQAEVERHAAREQRDGRADRKPDGADTHRPRGEAAVDQRPRTGPWRSPSRSPPAAGARSGRPGREPAPSTPAGGGRRTRSCPTA